MDESRQICFEVSTDGVAKLTLSHPPANAIGAQMARELRSLAIHCDEDPTIRAVVISGAGAMFCGGGDVSSFVGQGANLPAFVKDLTTDLHAAISRFSRMAAPLIAAVHGPAAGAGMSLACSADLVVAADTARFTLAYSRIGLTPDGSSTYFLPRLIGLRRALELALTNRTLSAGEALEWGLVNEVVHEGLVLDRALELARSLAAQPAAALGGAKRLLRESSTESLETQMEHETRVLADAARTSDATEGIAAFAEKRTPVFAHP